MRNDLKIAIVGHVDHGKSTIIGRLLADTGSLSEGKLQKIQRFCREKARQFEYAYVLDALQEEQSQGITIDTARCFFKTKLRRYMILDAPGHLEFLKNMVTGAAAADAVLLVIDASEGIKENTIRHIYMVSMLGIKDVIVLVNKMDLVNYQQSVFDEIVKDFAKISKKINIQVKQYIPVSGKEGDNIITLQQQGMPWYQGQTVLAALDGLANLADEHQSVFGMFVQDIYKFTTNDDTRRIIAGTVESGTIRVGDEVAFYPSGKIARLKSIEAFNRDYVFQAEAGVATGFTLTQELYLKRGELVVKREEVSPENIQRFQANVFWLGKEPLVKHKKYLLRIGTMEQELFLEEVHYVMDTASLQITTRSQINGNEAAECIFSVAKPIAFAKQLPAVFRRFVIVDGYDIAGGGTILQAVDDSSKADSKPKLIVHTGMPKTGTTSLQLSFYHNRERLKQMGIYLFSNQAGWDKTIHSVLNKYESNDKQKYLNLTQPDGNLANIKADFFASGCHTLMLTSEGIAFSEVAKSWIIKHFQEFDCTVVCYLRRQDFMIESCFNQFMKYNGYFVKNGILSQAQCEFPKTKALFGIDDIEDKYFANFLEYMLQEQVDFVHLRYYDALLPWLQAVGKDHLILRVYEKTQLPHGTIDDFYRNILGFSLEEYQRLEQIPNVNEKLHRDVLEFRLKCGVSEYFSWHYLNRMVSPATDYPHFLTKMQRKKIVDYFEQENNQLAIEFMGRADGKLFLEPIEEYPVYEGLTLDRAKEIAELFLDRTMPLGQLPLTFNFDNCQTADEVIQVTRGLYFSRPRKHFIQYALKTVLKCCAIEQRPAVIVLDHEEFLKDWELSDWVLEVAAAFAEMGEIYLIDATDKNIYRCWNSAVTFNMITFEDLKTVNPKVVFIAAFENEKAMIAKVQQQLSLETEILPLCNPDDNQWQGYGVQYF